MVPWDAVLRWPRLNCVAAAKTHTHVQLPACRRTGGVAADMQSADTCSLCDTKAAPLLLRWLDPRVRVGHRRLQQQPESRAAHGGHAPPLYSYLQGQTPPWAPALTDLHSSSCRHPSREFERADSPRCPPWTTAKTSEDLPAGKEEKPHLSDDPP